MTPFHEDQFGERARNSPGSDSEDLSFGTVTFNLYHYMTVASICPFLELMQWNSVEWRRKLQCRPVGLYICGCLLWTGNMGGRGQTCTVAVGKNLWKVLAVGHDSESNFE